MNAVRPALAGSHAAAWRDAGLGRALLDPRPPGLRRVPEAPHLERATDVIYRPETRRRSPWFEAVPPDRFGAFAWFAGTRAVAPLDPPPEETMP